MNIKALTLSSLIFISSMSYTMNPLNPVEQACNAVCDIGFSLNPFAWGACRTASAVINNPHVITGATAIVTGIAVNVGYSAVKERIDRLDGAHEAREERYKREDDLRERRVIAIEKRARLEDERNNLLAHQNVMLKENNDFLRKMYDSPLGK